MFRFTQDDLDEHRYIRQDAIDRESTLMKSPFKLSPLFLKELELIARSKPIQNELQGAFIEIQPGGIEDKFSVRFIF